MQNNNAAGMTRLVSLPTSGSCDGFCYADCSCRSLTPCPSDAWLHPETIDVRLKHRQRNSGLLHRFQEWRASQQRLRWRLRIESIQWQKRALDMFLSAGAILLLSPLALAIALAVRWDGGPVFFSQIRVGYRGKTFKMLKFRSMRVDAEKLLESVRSQNEKGEGVTFKIKNDPRVTRVGKFLRKVSLDELPQLWHVLVGDMSMVGPRPSLPSEVAKYTLEDRRRLESKPGITCLWQVGERNGGLLEIGDRNSIDFKEQVELDVRYIETRSLTKDIWLLVKTVLVVVKGTGA